MTKSYKNTEIDLFLSQLPESMDKRIIHLAIDTGFELYHNRKSPVGSDLFSFSLKMCRILLDMNVDATTLISTILHEIDINNEIIQTNIQLKFGTDVIKILKNNKELSRTIVRPVKNIEWQKRNFRRLVLATTIDFRVILIQFAKYLEILRSEAQISEEKAKSAALIVRNLLAPISHRLGIGMIKSELEDNAMKILDSETYLKYEKEVSIGQEERINAINRFIFPLKKRLKDENIEAKTTGRPKHIYSIYNKIIYRNKNFEDILDLLGVRIIVKTIQNCYHVLSLVHSIYEPVLSEFGDYISKPKSNMYQSLHTKVINKAGNIVEVQIRTEEMDIVAEMGVAAHWQYKERNQASENKSQHPKQYQAVRELLGNLEEKNQSDKSYEMFSLKLFTEYVYCFTPEGDIIQLPAESSPIDFAFAIHTQIGLSIKGAKVNQKIVPFSYKLKNFDIVAVQTSSKPKPSLDWLQYLKTQKAKSKLKRYFRKQNLENFTDIGKTLLKQELSKEKITLTNNDLKKVIDHFHCSSLDELHASLGIGDISSQGVLNAWTKIIQQDLDSDEFDNLELNQEFVASTTGITIDGDNDYITAFGECCNPIPGDEIFGFISKGRGIIIHKNDCPNRKALQKENSRTIDAAWTSVENSHFRTKIRIHSDNRKNIVHEITTILSKESVNIIDMKLEMKDGWGIGTISLDISDLDQLERILRNFSKIKGITNVRRLTT